MLKIRLMRIGARQKPFYRVVVIDERSKRNGAYVELLGTYNPLTQPKEIKLNKERVEHWLKQGAQKSDGFLRILGEAPQRPPRKPKKEKKIEEPAATSQQPAEEKPAEEAQPVTEEANVSEDAKSETAKASGEVEPTPEVNKTSKDPGATQTSSESTGETSDALQSDEPTSIETPVEKEPKNEGSA